ncbi:MAG: DUF3365 domain-containing protein [Desulfobulbaceae bacterium]|nr:DUF3365 domain-containing protein [Desulfobulbaceae bacterium]
MKNSSKNSAQRNVGLQARFLLGLALILLIFSAFAAGIIYFYEKNAIEEEAFQKTEIVMAAAGAARQYVRGTLRPRMYTLLGNDDFVLEAMSSSFISRAIMDHFKEDLPDFEYRRVAVNARNPVYEATGQERAMIHYFRDNPDQVEWRGLVQSEAGRHFMRYQPVKYTVGCSRCHGAPEDAPASIITKYGKEAGFHNRAGYINGLVSVGIPVDIGLAKTKELAFSVFGTVFLAVFFLFGIITFFFNRLVVQNLRQVLAIFRDTIQDDRGEEFMENLQTGEEIDDLTVLAGTMANHLNETREKLKDYVENLELKVDERTRKLQESENLLQEKIMARNMELNTLNVIAELITGSMDLNAILPKVLEHSLKTIPARGAGIYLFSAETSCLELQCRTNAPELVQQLEYRLPEVSGEMLAEPVDYSASICDAAYGHLNFFDNTSREERSLNLPLCCRDKILGVMTFVGTGFQEITAELQELLFSIGRQVGITIESLQSLARLSANKDLLQSVFDGITDLVVLVDCNGKFKMVNKSFLLRYRLQLEEVIDRPVYDRGTAVPHPFGDALLLLGSEGKEEKSGYVPTADGIIYETHFYPIFDTADAVINVVCYAKDVTEQKNIEQRMYQTEKLLALGQMAAGVAHEINNPLGVILCYTDILKEELAQSSQTRNDLEIIEKHARNCQHIVSDLLDFARGGKTVKKPVQLNVLIEEVLTVVRTQLRKDNIRILTDLSPELPPLLLDGDKIKQVMMNLIINGAQAMNGTGEIGLYTLFLDKRGLVQFIVEDNGVGIAEEVINKIFDPFFTTKEPGQGTGLGLSLAYGIIRDHGGDIEVESEPGSWTRFTVLLPVTGEDAGTETLFTEELKNG